ncbi:hypothetical protein MTR67_044328 [Solanum verrucosum]|uniref:Uncharacterized protein n=1 Tax=Solanum verrucosum TaxID=315347 RepID=A0AAF0ZV69_SOLVR|nr:hypothetical protein MTR67_044328 [Solanum verrucosum]
MSPSPHPLSEQKQGYPSPKEKVKSRDLGEAVTKKQKIVDVEHYEEMAVKKQDLIDDGENHNPRGKKFASAEKGQTNGLQTNTFNSF